VDDLVRESRVSSQFSSIGRDRSRLRILFVEIEVDLEFYWTR